MDESRKWQEMLKFLIKLFLIRFVVQWLRSLGDGSTYRNHPTKCLEKCVRFRECTLHQNWSLKDKAWTRRQILLSCLSGKHNLVDEHNHISCIELLQGNQNGPHCCTKVLQLKTWSLSEKLLQGDPNCLLHIIFQVLGLSLWIFQVILGSFLPFVLFVWSYCFI